MSESEKFFAHVERMHARLDEAERARANASYTGESDDQRVKATVNASGQLTGLEIDPRVFRNPDSEGLAEAVLQAADRARAAGEDDAKTAIGEILGLEVDPGALETNEAFKHEVLRLGRTLRIQAEEADG